MIYAGQEYVLELIFYLNKKIFYSLGTLLILFFIIENNGYGFL